MNHTSQGPPEKTNKKVSRACNTCRLKRKKCDGLEPCYFCIETKVECCYSREPRRRGPPSGYLRYTETRATLLETFLGHFILTSGSSKESLTDRLLESVNTLLSESKTCTQDIWDSHKSAWTSTEAARRLDELANTFSVFPQRLEQDSFAKPLLPVASVGTPTRSADTPLSTTHDNLITNDQAITSDVKLKSVSFAIPMEPVHILPDTPLLTSRESFERGQPPPLPYQSDLSNSQSASDCSEPPNAVFAANEFSNTPDHQVNGNTYSENSPQLQFPAPSSKTLDVQMIDVDSAASQTLLDQTRTVTDILMSGVDSGGLNDIGTYTGSYWRTAELALSELSVLPIATSTDGNQDYHSPDFIRTVEPLSNLQNYDAFDSHFPGPTGQCQYPSTPSGLASSLSYPLSPNLSSGSLGTTISSSVPHLRAPIPGPSALPMSTAQVPPDAMDLPPSHIISNLLDVYYGNVHLSFPFLPSREGMNFVLNINEGGFDAGIGRTLDEGTTCMLLALCAYTGRLAPGMSIGLGLRPNTENPHGVGIGSEGENVASNGVTQVLSSSKTDGIGGGRLGFVFGHEAGKIAADLWYEQARTSLNSLLRKPGRLETVQALLLLALRDHGKGAEGQAWLLVGLAIRMGQELQLANSSTAISGTSGLTLEQERQQRQNVWAISLILDMFLSLQLGKAPGVADSLREGSFKLITGGNAGVPFIHPLPKTPDTVFLHTYELCHIISRINFYLYLGFGPQNKMVTGNETAALPFSDPANKVSQEKLTILKAELDSWYQSLPMQYRIAIGHQPERDVLEINMYYHVALILLYRPFMKNEVLEYAREAYLDAASTFSVLLEKYKNLYYTPPAQAAQISQTSTSGPQAPTPVPAIYLSNPNLIYLIFTVALAHLSGYRLRRSEQYKPTRHAKPFQDIQTQLHLLNCLEALKAIGGTWELSRRCWKTVTRLMELEGLKLGQNGRPATSAPTGDGDMTQSSTPVSNEQLGKRKREEGDIHEYASPSSQRQRSNFYSSPSTALSQIPGFSRNVDFMSTSGQGSMKWDIGPPENVAGLGPASASTEPLLSDLIDHSSSAGWFPELPELLEADLSSLVNENGVWNGEWDERLWDNGTWMS
ncbi:nitrogen assimilation transcription factor nira [Moniliophthora roreri MCA 2997]|uniref:Nitrogen assimilation transcription factor nira n=1 Tax=Moniliophthora roreri (strain MCA 2997) TaxID=1381753 RepID=V2YT37_MONRO|nr:nitrogen assimilation transcription factor nira [Moniliophthora roreri MCA 2997]